MQSYLRHHEWIPWLMQFLFGLHLWICHWPVDRRLLGRWVLNQILEIRSGSLGVRIVLDGKAVRLLSERVWRSLFLQPLSPLLVKRILHSRKGICVLSHWICG